MPAVKMPRLSDSMESGVIVSWLVGDGDSVESGAPLVEIETDKATMVYEAPAAGVLRIVVQEGETAEVGAQLATLDGAAVGSDTAGPEAPKSDGAESDGAGRRERIIASPVARRLAAQAGVDLGLLDGSGPRGRIVKRDVEAAQGAQGEGPPGDGGPAAAGGEVRQLTRVQEIIARRMSESHEVVPDFSLTVEVDMAALLELRERMRADADDDPIPSVTDFVIKASALALRGAPRANGSYRDGAWQLHERVSVGVAVAAQEALLVPAVRDADRLGLGEIARATRELARRARDGALTPAELDGGTFTVSNLGMFGIDRFVAIVNAPQAAILAVGAVTDRVVAHEGQPAIRPRMEMTLSCDHRILYGADAAQFLGAIRDGLQRPTRLVL